ncbi:MAG: queuosine precursor transporter, partial [Mycoplasmatales bacterium]
MNFELILIGTLAILCNYALILLAFKFFGKLGLYICVPIVIIIANIQVVVTIDFLGMAMTLGNIAYVSSYLITDLLGELYGKKEAQRAVNIGFFALLTIIIIMNIMLLSKPFVNADSMQMYESIANIFGVMPRI